jgi:hypothetical protein
VLLEKAAARSVGFFVALMLESKHDQARSIPKPYSVPSKDIARLRA